MKYFLIVFILFQASLIHANQNKIPCLVINFRTYDTPATEGANVASLIKAGLSDNSFYFLQESDEVRVILSESDCSLDCIEKLQKIYPDALVITGSVKRIENTIGEKKISKYLVEELKEEKYIFSVKVINLKKNQVDLLFEEEFPGIKELKTETARIALEINNFYKVEKPIVNEPEKNEDKTPFLVLTGFSIMPAYLKTAGSYKKIAEQGYGLSAGLKASTSWIDNFFLGIRASSFMLTETKDKIDSAYMFSSHLIAGYTFDIYKSIKVSPLAGPGYIFHYINGTRGSTESKSSEFYYNPSFNAGVEISWLFAEKYEVIFLPSWGVFFEQNSNPHYMLLNIGIRKNF